MLTKSEALFIKSNYMHPCHSILTEVLYPLQRQKHQVITLGCFQWCKKQYWHACGSLLFLPSRPGKNTFLFYTHRRGLGKRITAWDCITLSQNPLQRRKTSLNLESKHSHLRKVLAAILPGRENFQDDRASLKTPERNGRTPFYQ